MFFISCFYGFLDIAEDSAEDAGIDEELSGDFYPIIHIVFIWCCVYGEYFVPQMLKEAATILKAATAQGKAGMTETLCRSLLTIAGNDPGLLALEVSCATVVEKVQ